MHSRVRVLSGSANYIGFDTMTVGSKTPVVTPEPAALTLFGSRLLGLVGLARRRRQVQSE